MYNPTYGTEHDHWLREEEAQQSLPTSANEAGDGGILIGAGTGSREQVKEWQSYLIKKGYNIGSYCVDGKFGSATERATRQLANALGVVSDGEVTMALWNAVSDDSALFMRDVTTADKDRGCPGWRGGATSSSAPVAPTSGPAQPGPLGKVAEAAMSPRGILIGVSALLIGAGIVSARRGRSNYDPANWTW